MQQQPITPELQRAIDRVKTFFPALSIICFSKRGIWVYMDEDFNAFDFTPVINDIDVDILNEAASSIRELPAIFDLSENS